MKEDNHGLRAQLESEGLKVMEVPCLGIVHRPPPEDEIHRLEAMPGIDAALFASRHGVDGFFNWLDAAPEWRGRITPRLVGAVGPATARRLDGRGWTADIVASPATGERLAEGMIKSLKPESHILAIRGSKSLNAASRRLKAAGHRVASLTVYENRAPLVPRIDAPFGIVVFASPSAAERFFAANPQAPEVTAVAIGPTTAGWLKGRGIRAVMAPSTDDDALAGAVLAAVSERIGSGK